MINVVCENRKRIYFERTLNKGRCCYLKMLLIIMQQVTFFLLNLLNKEKHNFYNTVIISL